jgi:hypothetical protein
MIRSPWPLLGATALALTAGGAALGRLEAGLARAESAAAALATAEQPLRAEQAMADWGRPWLETFLRHRGQPAAAAEVLLSCQASLLTRLDSLSGEKNRVPHTRLKQAEIEAATCAEPTLGTPLSRAFARELRVRWDAWVAHEGPSTAP